MEQLIKELFDSLVKDSDEKTKQASILNDRIKNYDKQSEINNLSTK